MKKKDILYPVEKIEDNGQTKPYKSNCFVKLNL